MKTNLESLTVHEGMDVFSTEGEKLGSVDRIEGDYVVAKKGWLFPTDIYLPGDAVASIDEDRVILNVTKDQVLEQGWDVPPGDRQNEGVLVTEDQSYLEGVTNAGAAPLTGDGVFSDSTRLNGIPVELEPDDAVDDDIDRRNS